MSRRKVSPPPAAWRCRTGQRHGAVCGGTSGDAGRTADDGTEMGVHDSDIAAGRAGYLLAICGRLSSRVWHAGVPVISLPPVELTALLPMLARWASSGSAVPLFGITQPFKNTFAQFIRVHRVQLREHSVCRGRRDKSMLSRRPRPFRAWQVQR